MKIIGISGKAGSGKDTVGRILHSIYQEKKDPFGFPIISCEKLSFANKLKDVCVLMFGWDRNRLEGDFDYKEGRHLDDGTEDPACTMLNMTRREVMQKVGTDAMRNGLHRDIWVILLRLAITRGEYDSNIGFITDCRFKNELQFVRDMGGALIRVDREGGVDTLTSHTNHQSETDWLDWDDWDFVIKNRFDPELSAEDNLEVLESTLRETATDVMRGYSFDLENKKHYG